MKIFLDKMVIEFKSVDEGIEFINKYNMPTINILTQNETFQPGIRYMANDIYNNSGASI